MEGLLSEAIDKCMRKNLNGQYIFLGDQQKNREMCKNVTVNDNFAAFQMYAF